MSVVVRREGLTFVFRRLYHLLSKSPVLEETVYIPTIFTGSLDIGRHSVVLELCGHRCALVSEQVDRTSTKVRTETELLLSVLDLKLAQWSN